MSDTFDPEGDEPEDEKEIPPEQEALRAEDVFPLIRKQIAGVRRR